MIRIAADIGHRTCRPVTRLGAECTSVDGRHGSSIQMSVDDPQSVTQESGWLIPLHTNRWLLTVRTAAVMQPWKLIVCRRERYGKIPIFDQLRRLCITEDLLQLGPTYNGRDLMLVWSVWLKWKLVLRTCSCHVVPVLSLL